MARRISVLDSAFFNIDIVLASQSYNLLFKFNTSDKSWYITIRNPNLEVLVSGIKVMPNQNLTGAFKYLDILPDGDLWCVRRTSSKEPVGRDNFGVDKTYELLWISSQEATEGLLDGIIQL